MKTMRTLLSRMLALLFAGALVSLTMSSPDRGRSMDVDSIDHFHHLHDDLMGMDSDHHTPPHGVCEPIKIGE